MSQDINTKLLEEVAYYIDLPTHKYLVARMIASNEANDLEDLYQCVQEARQLEEEELTNE